MFLPCDVLFASITEQTTEKWNLFVLYNKYMNKYISKDLLNFPGEFLGHLKRWIASADVIHDLNKSSNVIGS